MARREEPLRARPRTRPDAERDIRSPSAPARDERCLGAAAQLAAVHRTLRYGQVLQRGAGGGATWGQAEGAAPANRTGLPDRLKAGVEALSGVSLDGVKVHYNSSKPAQLNALAYAQGTDIHLGPGQERHLPHEAWHIVQQAQGRVRPTRQLKNGPQINDQEALEREADEMGARALGRTVAPAAPNLGETTPGNGESGPRQLKSAVIQRFSVPGTIVEVDGTIYFRNAQGKDKDIPSDIVNSLSLKEHIGTKADAEVDGKTFAVTSIVLSNKYVAPKNAEKKPITASVSPATLKHVWERHTLHGIHEAGAVKTDYKGDNVALFPKKTTWEGLKTILMEIDGQPLAWKSRGSSQFEADYKGIHVIGTAMGDVIDLQTAFPKESLLISKVEYFLDKYEFSWQAFLLYVPDPS